MPDPSSPIRPKPPFGPSSPTSAKTIPRATRRVRTEFQQAFKMLAGHPHFGHTREDLTDRPVRFWRLHSYLIVYRHETHPLQVLRVLHGAQDVARELRRA